MSSGLLFTAFEPSGDDHAAPVIAELKRRHPSLPIYAWGGPRMASAGATIVERTGDNAVMGLPGPRKIAEHLAINRRVAKWLDQPGGCPASIHVPVDSPGANFPICKLTRPRGLKVVHLVAPQMWAWGSWRVSKLRRLSDLVLCVLPFEPEWFLARGVQARFIGHPLFDHPLDLVRVRQRAQSINAGLPSSAAAAGTTEPPRLALMPGSRPAEMKRCFPVLLDAYRRISSDFPGTSGVVAATSNTTSQRLREMASTLGGWPGGLDMVVNDTDATVYWCDFALVVSGTVTLQIARQARPMVALYRPSKLMYYGLVKWLVATRYFTLPNLIANQPIIPELIPHFGDGEALAVEVIKFLRRPGYAQTQREALGEIIERFRGQSAAIVAADAIEEVAGLKSLSSSPAPLSPISPPSPLAMPARP
jgi:lipid-A-disaccharide synthase